MIRVVDIMLLLVLDEVAVSTACHTDTDLQTYSPVCTSVCSASGLTRIVLWFGIGDKRWVGPLRHQNNNSWHTSCLTCSVCCFHAVCFDLCLIISFNFLSSLPAYPSFILLTHLPLLPQSPLPPPFLLLCPPLWHILWVNLNCFSI